MSTLCLEKQPISGEDPDTVDAYLALCKETGVVSLKACYLSLRSFLAKHGICEYDPQKVHAFLKAKAKEQNMDYVWVPLRKKDCKGTCTFQHQEREDVTVHKYLFTLGLILFLGAPVWLLCCGLAMWSLPSFLNFGCTAIVWFIGVVLCICSTKDRIYGESVSTETYQDLVPAAALSTVKRVGEQFPSARFFVSDVRQQERHYPDPFLAVTFPGQPFTIIEWWNEPNFRP